MNALLLDVWEEGRTSTPVARAITLLRLAFPESSREERESMPVGRRDAALIDLRRRLFGPEIVSVATCPTCGERVEITFQTEDILVLGASDAEGPGSLEVDDFLLTYRLPASRDLLAVQGTGDVNEASRQVLEGCLLSAVFQEAPVSFSQLPESVIDALAARFAEEDPQADVQLSLCCPECEEKWEIVFDIASFLWTEVQAVAERLLLDVHVLASNYGWSERDILSLPAARRQFYLQEIGG
jgi:hypothetical protein